MDESGRRRVLGTIGQMSELQDRLEGGDGAALSQLWALARREIEWIESQELSTDRPADDPMELLLMYLCALESVVRRALDALPAQSPTRNRLGGFLVTAIESLNGAFLPGPGPAS